MAGPQAIPPQHPGQEQYPNQPQPAQGNGMAVAALVLGILGLVFSFAMGIGFIFALMGLIFGIVGMKKANRIGGKGKGMAVTGLITGIIGLIPALSLSVLPFLQ